MNECLDAEVPGEPNEGAVKGDGDAALSHSKLLHMCGQVLFCGYCVYEGALEGDGCALCVVVGVCSLCAVS